MYQDLDSVPPSAFFGAYPNVFGYMSPTTGIWSYVSATTRANIIGASNPMNPNVPAKVAVTWVWNATTKDWDLKYPNATHSCVCGTQHKFSVKPKNIDNYPFPMPNGMEIEFPCC